MEALLVVIRKLCCKVAGKSIANMAPLQEFLCWIYYVLGESYLRRLSGLMDSKTDSRSGDPRSYPERGDSSILII